MITSFKGGVGKSTISVNLAIGFAVSKYKVLIIDIDASSGSIDLFMGCESDTIYNFCDVIEGKVKIEDAVYVKKSYFNPNRKNNFSNIANIANIPNKLINLNNSDAPGNSAASDKPDGADNTQEQPYYSVDVLKSPSSYDLTKFSDEEIKEFIKKAKEIYDFIIFDCPSGRFPFFDSLAKNTDYIFVITLHSAASIRSSEKMALFLSETGNDGEKVRLIINCFNPKGISRGLNLGIVDIIERSKIKLIGLIEINNMLRDYQELGKTAYDVRTRKLRRFFDDIIGRVLESNIILNRKYDGIKTNNLYFKKEVKDTTKV